MGAGPQTQALVDFLGGLQQQAALPRTIVYNLNPNESAAICCAVQNFQDSSCPGKIQYGPAWWHLDHKRGIIEQLDLLIRIGAFRFCGINKYELMWEKNAVFNPQETTALYFVATGLGDGRHFFSDNYKQHRKAVIKYQLNGKKSRYQGDK